MAETKTPKDTAQITGSPTPPGLYDRAQSPRVSGIEMAAAGFAAIWLLICVIFFVFFDGGEGLNSLRFILILMVVFLPVGMIWVAATAARASAVMREESARLQAAIDAIRRAYLNQPGNQTAPSDKTITRKLDEIAAAQRKTESALATFTSSRPPRAPLASMAPAPEAEDQVPLALGTPAEALAPPLAKEDFIRALNFPETAQDEEGFAALRRALRDRQAAQLIQASQDVLTLLSHDGIYMDDLRPDYARPEIWRSFAGGKRGREIAALGGIRDRSSLALAATRMKQDPIFRDAAHHFLRRFDQGLATFEKAATDAEIQALAETRTSRAFMLLGRIAGTFD